MAGDQTLPAGSMFSLGWLMARLFGPPGQPDNKIWTHLPALSELGTDDYVDLAFAELDKLLSLLPGGLSGAGVKAAWGTGGHAGFTAAVGQLHLEILQALAADHQQLGAYQLGLALSDICLRPGQAGDGTFVLAEFGRQPMAALQTWLAQASAVLPPASAATVSRSLQNWQDWADVNQGSGTDKSSPTPAPVLQALRTQGAVWYALLSGETDMDGQLSVDAWIKAGQSIAKTSGQLVRAILRRFWPAVLIVALATAGLLFLAIDKSAGTAKVWTSLITVAAAFGFTGASVRVAAKKAADGLEQEVEHAAALDARAWSATWLPALPQSPANRLRLARRGVAMPRIKPHLERTVRPAPPARRAAAPLEAARP
ncbi:MAG: hypothetical protein WAK82_30850 [Streptosporangiaceae bacterium]